MPDRHGTSTGRLRARTGLRRFAGATFVATALALIAAACGGGDDGGTRSADDGPRSIALTNHGGDLEGHTPRGFAGSGTGLFIGDNLNPDFPEGEGIQLLLTFELPDDVDQVLSASITTDVMEVRGDPFTTLGLIEAEPVSYDEFGPQLFDLAADGDAVDCLRVGPSGLICDVTEAAVAGVDAGRDRLQFRLQFQNLADNDGEQDLALFHLTDTNRNERGIFVLNLRGS